MLPSESQNRLKTLLPPTAFREWQPCLAPDHPAYNGESSKISDSSGHTVDPSVFTDPHCAHRPSCPSPRKLTLEPVLAAARTFQDHIFSGWTTTAQEEKVQKYLQQIKEGSLHAPWKDDEWMRNNVETPVESNGLAGYVSALPKVAKCSPIWIHQRGRRS